MIKRLFLTACLVTASLAAQASGNLLTNGGFEAAGPDYSPGFPSDGSYCYLGVSGLDCGTIPGWTGNSPVALLSSSGAWGNPSGLAGWDGSFGNALIGVQGTSFLQQDVTLAAGSYVLSWFDANRTNYGSNQSYDVYQGATLLGSFNTVAGAGWAQHSLSFSTAGGLVSLKFQGTVFADATTFLDNISLISAVPEPSIAALMLAGLLPLLARRRRSA